MPCTPPRETRAVRTLASVREPRLIVKTSARRMCWFDHAGLMEPERINVIIRVQDIKCRNVVFVAKDCTDKEFDEFLVCNKHAQRIIDLFRC